MMFVASVHRMLWVNIYIYVYILYIKRRKTDKNPGATYVLIAYYMYIVLSDTRLKFTEELRAFILHATSMVEYQYEFICLNFFLKPVSI